MVNGSAWVSVGVGDGVEVRAEDVVITSQDSVSISYDQVVRACKTISRANHYVIINGQLAA